MNTTTVNLKQLYQRLEIWPAFLILLATLAIIINNYGGLGKHLLLYSSCWLGAFGSNIAGVYAEPMANPMTFCLPGHQHITRKLLFAFGILPVIVFTVLLFCCTEISATLRFMDFITILALFWVAYLVGIILTFKTRNYSNGIYFLILPISIYNLIDFNGLILQRLPYQVITSAILLSIIIWRYLGNPNTARTICGSVFYGFSSFGTNRKQKNQRASYKKYTTKFNDMFQVTESIKSLFMDRISAAMPGSIDQYYWGGLYKTLAVEASHITNPLVWLIVSFLLLLLGYLGSSNLIFIIPAMAASYYDLNIHTSHLYAGSRIDKYKAGGMLMLTYMLISVLITLLLITITIILQSILPDITLGGKTFTYSAHIRPCAISLLMIIAPLCAILNLLFNHKKNKSIFTIHAFLITLVLIGPISRGTQLGVYYGVILTIFGVVGWLGFVLLLKRTCLKADLAR